MQDFLSPLVFAFLESLGNLTGERYSIELGSSAFVLDVAKALDRLRGRLPQETVARVRAELEKRAQESEARVKKVLEAVRG